MCLAGGERRCGACFAAYGASLYYGWELEGQLTMRPDAKLMQAALTGALGGLLYGFE
jgi:hypothetical protein